MQALASARQLDLKPDFFSTHPGFYVSKPMPGEPSSSDTKSNRGKVALWEYRQTMANDLRFGVLASWQLRDCVSAVVESKLKVKMQRSRCWMASKKERAPRRSLVVALRAGLRCGERR
jgi:hypothetical protein